MTRAARLFMLLAVALCFFVGFGTAVAQTNGTIAGQVSDATGGVLPGVTVEATSPVLIEGNRLAVSDGQGRYAIIDLRPGTYRLTFSLPGFTTVIRDELPLTAAATLTINVEMRVGSIEESVTVSGQSPIVDVQQATRVETLSRDLMDSLPTARNFQTIGSLMPGVKLDRPDVGGARAMEQTYMYAHGSSPYQNTIQIDGMKVNSLMFDGVIQTYHNDAMHAEVTYQTSGFGAETQSAGVRLNMIPREGGNTLSGSGYFGGSHAGWQGQNITPKLRNLGITQGDEIDLITDLNLALGGPLIRDKLWFFGSGRDQRVTEVVIDSFFSLTGSQEVSRTPPPIDPSRPATQRQFVRNAMLRLTYQVSPRNKFTVYMDRIFKFKEHELFFTRSDPDTGSHRRDVNNMIYYTAQAKWTSTVSSKLLLEAGYSSNVENLSIFYQPGIRKSAPANLRACLATPCYWEPGYDQSTPWHAQAMKWDLVRGNVWNAGYLEKNWYPERFVIAGSASYVTGSHAFKTGVQWDFGPYPDLLNYNAHLQQLYLSGVPALVRVAPAPLYSDTRLNYDLGIYAQDTWTLGRLTLTPGFRVDGLNAQINEENAPAGRFVPARHFQKRENLPDWWDVSPRVGVAYDVFGNAKTAVKFSTGRYFRGMTTGFAQRYDPMFEAYDTRSWTDRDLLGRDLPTNGDDIAQDNEIGPSSDRFFGQAPTRRPDPDLQREGNWMTNVSLQQEVLPRVSVSVGYYRRTYHDLERRDNLLVGPQDWTLLQLADPRGGDRTVPVWNLSPSKLGLVDELNTNTKEDSIVYNGLELSFNARLPNGAAFFGGWTTERTVFDVCEQFEDGRFEERSIYAGMAFTGLPQATFRFCDETQFDIPFRHEYKLAGAYPLPLGIQASMAFQSFAGIEHRRIWTVPTSAFTAVGAVRTRSVVTQLDEPGTRYLDRWNQLDAGFSKRFQIGRHQLEGLVNIYNLNNSSVILLEAREFGSAAGGQQRPTRTMQPRMFRLGMQWKF